MDSNESKNIDDDVENQSTERIEFETLGPLASSSKKRKQKNGKTRKHSLALWNSTSHKQAVRNRSLSLDSKRLQEAWTEINGRLRNNLETDLTMSVNPYNKKRPGITQVSHRTSLLAGGKQRKTRNGIKEQFTILSSSQNKKKFLKVLVPNRNPIEDLYKLFPQLPPGEKPLNDFSCALYKDILLQGKMIICSSCICFHSNIFGYETRVIIHFKNVVAIKRERTAFVVPNAISVRTVKKRYLFCSFLSRETSFKLLSRIWKQAVHMEPDENDNSPTDPIKIRPGGAKEASDDLLNFSSSSSFGSSFPRPTALPDRAFITALFRWIGCFQ
ncbi:GRAM domain-containing protein 2A-like isoform X2 [Clytia hemisphaerica]